MKIETEYDINDTVYLVREGKVICGTINGIKIEAKSKQVTKPHEKKMELINTVTYTAKGVFVNYYVAIDGLCGALIKSQHELYKTKEGLIASL